MIDASTSFYITLGFSIVSGVIGYYVGERGWSGVESDLNNVKLDIENLKNRLNGTQSTTTTSSTPTGIVSNTVTTPAVDPVATH
jgi:hypothetical protein